MTLLFGHAYTDPRTLPVAAPFGRRRLSAVGLAVRPAWLSRGSGGLFFGFGLLEGDGVAEGLELAL